MFVWVWIHLWRVFVMEIPRKLTCGNSFCKFTGSGTLISMKQDSTREKIWRRTEKSQLLKLLKRKNTHGVFINLKLTGNGRLLWPFPGKIKTKKFLLSTQNQRCLNVKFSRWFNVGKLILFRRWKTVTFSTLM